MAFGEWAALLAIACGLVGAASFSWAVLMWIHTERGSRADKQADRIGGVGCFLLALLFAWVIVGVVVWGRNA